MIVLTFSLSFPVFKQTYSFYSHAFFPMHLHSALMLTVPK
uniref:Uncharacterized protein n=1 Tax=Arundo donax TaxID=35708 RepID=A0A0A9AN18_ARUDO